MYAILPAPLILAAALAAAGPLSPAFAGKTAAPAAADQTLGTAILSAFVDSVGTLVAGHGVIGSEKIAPGRYLLRLSRNVNLLDCQIAATAIHPHFASISGAGPDNSLIIFTHNGFDGSDFDSAFQVIVFCAQ